MQLSIRRGPYNCLVGSYMLTQHAGPGKVLAVKFFNGAGYVLPLWRNRFRVRGFTFFIRLKKQKLKSYNHDPRYPHRKEATSGFHPPYPRFTVTTNPNKYLM